MHPSPINNRERTILVAGLQELGNKLRADPKLQAVLSLVELTVLYHKIRGVDPEQLRQIEASLIAQQELADIMAANQATKH